MSKKILYAASTVSHLEKFHAPYLVELRRAGHTVATMADGKGADIDIRLKKRMLSPSNLLRILKIARILQRERYDLVILNTTLMSVAIRLVLPRKNRPRVLNISHGYLFTREKRTFRERVLCFVERLLAGRTDAIAVMNSEDLYLARKYRLCRENVYFIPGMGVGALTPMADRSKMRHVLGLDGKFVITFVGELSKRKNQSFLIRAMAEILPIIPSAHLLLVGEGGERVRLSRLAEHIGVSRSISFLGYRRDVISILGATDLYVSASLCEGLPFNVVEALSLGLTVLVSDVKGHVDIVRSGIDGYTFKSDIIDDFVNKTFRIYSKILKIDPRAAIERSSKFAFDSAYFTVLNVIRKEIDHANHNSQIREREGAP